ncbi:MAG: hypothetical protein EA424_06140 [Planctomycetaceae bacterium]|nr:MAG: hypothetical protein EA424_06140 [Planctomycetaceae bacterium]
MRTIEATMLIAEDRKLVLQLPSDVSPGEHRVVLMIDEPKPVREETGEHEQTPTRWEGNVLVYDGVVEGPIEDAVRQHREERIQHLMKQALQ